MGKQYTDSLKNALDRAKEWVRFDEQGGIGTEHLLLGLIAEKDADAGVLLAEAGVEEEAFERLLDRYATLDGGMALRFADAFSIRARRALEKAETLAAESHDEQVGTEHVLLAILLDGESVGTRLLHTMGIDIDRLIADTIRSTGMARYLDPEHIREEGNAQSATPTLDEFSRDLTAMAAAGQLDPVIGREKEMNRVMQILSRRTKNNPCLIGEPGVGKTAIVEGLARRIASGQVPETLRNRRLLRLDLSGMVAGTKYRGEFEERVKNLISETAANREVLLFIDELHTIIGAGGAEGALDTSNMLKPALSRGEIQVIGATTIEEYRKYVEKDAALERRFQPVQVEEPSKEETLAILQGLRPQYEQHHGVRIPDEALEAAVDLSERYINDRRLPDKAIDLIDEAASKLRLRTSSAGRGKDLSAQILQLARDKEEAIAAGDLAAASEIAKKQVRLKRAAERAARSDPEAVGTEIVAEVVSETTGIPLTRLAEKESKRLKNLSKELHKRIIGQDEAVDAVASAIKRGRVGLKDPNRPIGSFLLLGPTGVGKTELSKAVAESVFGSEESMIRVDMSEYMEKHNVSKLIGSPPGYVGYEEGGQLSEQVRRHPYSVLLFDEIEKAHPDVFNILLQVLDEGHITDAHGRRVSFKNTVIIMSSNAGAKSIVEPKLLGFGASGDAVKEYSAMKRNVMEEVQRIFRPEFLNRIDSIIVFHPLTKEDVAKIVGLQLGILKKRAKKQMNITLSVTPSAVTYLTEKGFSVKYGARPVRRAIREKIEDPLAEKILEGSVVPGDTLRIAAGRDGELHFTKKAEKKTDGKG